MAGDVLGRTAALALGESPGRGPRAHPHPIPSRPLPCRVPAGRARGAALGAHRERPQRRAGPSPGTGGVAALLTQCQLLCRALAAPRAPSPAYLLKAAPGKQGLLLLGPRVQPVAPEGSVPREPLRFYRTQCTDWFFK